MAQTEELTIDRGSDVAIELHLISSDGSTKDLTNYSVASKMKKSYNSTDSDTTDFLAIIAEPATDGVATISLTNTETDLLKPGRYVYDVEISFVDSDAATIVEKVLEGYITVMPSVTR